MKKTNILVLAIVFLSVTFTHLTAQETAAFLVNTNNSSVAWKGYKPAGSHNGSIQLQSGQIHTEGENITGGFFTATMSTIEDADGSKKLTKHLKSKDFFEIDVFPTATFEISKITPKENKILLTGDITIKGVTKQISFLANLSHAENTLTLTSDTFQLNRVDFNVKYKSKSFFNNLKDKFINDEFDLQVTIVAQK